MISELDKKSIAESLRRIKANLQKLTELCQTAKDR